MSSFVDIMQAVADQIVRLRDRVDELERLETYYGTLDLNGFTFEMLSNTTIDGNSHTITVNADTTLNGTPAAAVHTHAASDITSGTMNTARLGSGTASASTLLFGDNTWAALAATDIPSLDASKITTGTLPLTRGGTGATSAAGALSAIGAAAASHAHAATDITSGTVATARLGSGSASSTTALFGDQTYKTVPTGSGADNCLVLWNGTTGLTYDLNTYTDGTTIVSTNFKFDSGGGYYDSSANKLLGTRRTGWSAWTGTATRSSKATSTATTADVAQALKALIDDLSTHGIIGG